MVSDATLLDPLPRRPRIVRWFAARPRIGDVFVIVVCTVPTITALVLAPPAHAWLGYVCTGGVAVAFWWRRSHPVVVLLIVVAFGALNPISSQGTSVAILETMFGVYAVASLTRLRTAILAYLAGEATIFATAGVAMLLGLRDVLPFVLLQPIALAALALGLAVRSSRARRAAVEAMIVMREERAAAAERARITAEMHDVVAHSVTVMIALAGGARTGWERHPDRARSALEQLGVVGARTLDEMQRILRLLREPDGTSIASIAASGHDVPSLASLVEEFRTAGLPVVLDESATARTDEPALRTTVYRIVQESLTNALRYARGATRIDVRVEADGDRLVVTVTVTDDGAADPSASSLGAGVGLRAMRERAAAFDGTLEAGPVAPDDRAPATGWRVRATLPQREAEHA